MDQSKEPQTRKADPNPSRDLKIRKLALQPDVLSPHRHVSRWRLSRGFTKLFSTPEAAGNRYSNHIPSWIRYEG
jgi:hypothetical protein